MTIFTHGNDKGSIFLQALVAMFFLFILLVTLLELEYREYKLAKMKYEKVLIEYKVHSETDF